MTILAIAIAAIAALGLLAVGGRNWARIIEDDDPEDFSDEYPSVLRQIWRDEDER